MGRDSISTPYTEEHGQGHSALNLPVPYCESPPLFTLRNQADTSQNDVCGGFYIKLSKKSIILV